MPRALVVYGSGGLGYGPGSRRPLTTEQKDTIRELAAAGWDKYRIAHKVGCSDTSVRRHWGLPERDKVKKGDGLNRSRGYSPKPRKLKREIDVIDVDALYDEVAAAPAAPTQSVENIAPLQVVRVKEEPEVIELALFTRSGKRRSSDEPSMTIAELHTPRRSRRAAETNKPTFHDQVKRGRIGASDDEDEESSDLSPEDDDSSPDYKAYRKRVRPSRSKKNQSAVPLGKRASHLAARKPGYYREKAGMGDAHAQYEDVDTSMVNTHRKSSQHAEHESGTRRPTDPQLVSSRHEQRWQPPFERIREARRRKSGSGSHENPEVVSNANTHQSIWAQQMNGGMLAPVSNNIHPNANAMFMQMAQAGKPPMMMMQGQNGIAVFANPAQMSLPGSPEPALHEVRENSLSPVLPARRRKKNRNGDSAVLDFLNSLNPEKSYLLNSFHKANIVSAEDLATIAVLDDAQSSSKSQARLSRLLMEKAGLTELEYYAVLDGLERQRTG